MWIKRTIPFLGLFVILLGLTFTVNPVFAANANLFVSAEKSLFDNFMSGPQVIEVVVIDSDINDTNEAKAEPEVFVNGKILRMVQAVDGNWYGYFSDIGQANFADDTTTVVGVGLDFGKICSVADAAALISEAGDADFFSDASGVAVSAVDCTTDTFDETDINVLREAKDANDNVSPTPDDVGQVGINGVDSFPFIQLYTLSVGGNVVVQYNKGGGAQTTTLTF